MDAENTKLPVVERRERTTFHCPGDPQPISRSLHLARLVAGHTACRECPHRQETGILPERITRPSLLRKPASLVTADGIRGLYLNELTRERIARVTAHVIHLADAELQAELQGRGGNVPRLRVVVGHDARPSSPDLAIGVVSALRRSGCEIADVSRVSRACFEFAVHRFRPDLGLYVTGGMKKEHWNGMDIVDAAAVPWCEPGKLTPLAGLLDLESSRIARVQGEYQPVQIEPDYETELQARFHAIRPLRVVIGCSDVLCCKTLRRLFERTPCIDQYVNVSISQSFGDQQLQLADAMRERHADVGFLIGADGRACSMLDESGMPFSSDETLQLLSVGILDRALQRRLAVTLTSEVNGPDSQPQFQDGFSRVAGSQADLLRFQHAEGVAIAADGVGRYWFLGEVPRCDAILTVVKLLQVLSLSDRLVSEQRSRSVA